MQHAFYLRCPALPRNYAKALLGVVVLLAFCLLAPQADASKAPVGEFGTTGTGNGEFQTLGMLAVDEGSGAVYAVDQGNNRIQKFDADGVFQLTFGSDVDPGGGTGAEVCTAPTTCQAGVAAAGDGEFTSPTGIAVDQADGSLYVTDTGNSRVQHFSASGAYLGQFGLAGAGNGEFSSPTGMAVDPTDAAVYVVDQGNNRIQRFDSSGVFELAFGGDVDPGGGTGAEVCSAPTTCQAGVAGGGEGEFSGATRVAVDSSGAVYVLEGFNRVQKFDAAASFLAQFAPTALFVQEISVDLSNDHVLIGDIKSDFSAFQVEEYDSSGTLIDTHQIGSAFGFPGLATNPSTGLIYRATEVDTIIILDEAVPPAVTLEPVLDPTADEADFIGHVNPQGLATTARFEYSPDAGATWKPLSLHDSSTDPGLASSTAEVELTDTATGLQPSTDYLVRLTATNAGGTVLSTSEAFETDPVVPEVQPLAAGLLTDTTAQLGAEINPRNAPTTYYVEYATDPSFEPSDKAPADLKADAGAGGAFAAFSQLVSGLAPETTYYFRVVAENDAGPAIGADKTFTTLPASIAPNQRVYEKVSPADKNGADIDPGSLYREVFAHLGQASLSGDRVAYASQGNFGGEGGSPYVQYLATRGSAGWTTAGITPRFGPSPVAGGQAPYQWFSPDLSLGAVTTSEPLNDGDPLFPRTDGGFREMLYLRNVDANTYQLLSKPTVPPSVPLGAATVMLQAASADNRKLAFDSSYTLTSDPTTGRQAYLWVDGTVEYVGVLPEHTIAERSAIGAGNGGGFFNQFEGENPMSSDGVRVFFTRLDSPNPTIMGLYVRENGSTTTALNPTQSAVFEGARQSDGAIAFFSSEDKLTGDAPAGTAGATQCGTVEAGGGRHFGCFDLYRWEADAPPGEELTDLTTADPDGGGVVGVVGISDDATTVYFVATGELTPEAAGKRPKLYLWKQGSGVRLIATLASGLTDYGTWNTRLFSGSQGEVGYAGHPRVTSDGDRLLFTSRARITPYDNAGHKQVYLYDQSADQTICLSCNARSASSSSDAYFSVADSGLFPSGQASATRSLPRNLSGDGTEAYFNTAEALIPSDTNGKIDVYAWSDGRVRLLTTGESGDDSFFLDAGEDGRDVFFTTREPLTRSDGDDLIDLYDARVGGREEPAIEPTCQGDECQGTPTAPPVFDNPGSSSLAGSATSKSPRKCRRGRTLRKGKCVKRRPRRPVDRNRGGLR